jgi:hypothetical protein
MNTCRPQPTASLTVLAIASSLALLATQAQGDARLPALDHGPWQQECGSCHVPYPPHLLSAASWRAVMAGLDQHFGVDASLDPAAREDIQRFLEQHASRRETSEGGKPLLQITATRWFRSEHSEELPANVWKRPEVKTPADCAACHTGAAHGDYSERTLRVPGGSLR